MNRNISALALILLSAASASLLAAPQSGEKATAPQDASSMGDMKGMDMKGMDMKGMDMKGMDMKGMDMKGMDMKGMDMKGMKMDTDAGKAEFAKLDANRDGKLSQAELPAKHPLAAKFAALDTDRDGSLSPAEFAAGCRK